MTTNFLPELPEPSANAADEVVLIASGDSRLAANRICWPAQAEFEKQLGVAFAAEGMRVHRGHAYDPELGHGFLDSQRMGLDTFMKIHPKARIVVAEAVWQYSHHVLPGLRSHQGPILTVANWSGQWPGLVGLLNLNACLRKAGVPFSTIWSKDFTDSFFRLGLRQWLADKRIQHNGSHVRDFDVSAISREESALGSRLAKYMQRRKAVMGIFDEGCMGMYNSIIDDELLNPIGIFKERLSQSALVAAMRSVSDSEAQGVRDWLDRRGVHFAFGPDPETDLSPEQVLEQCKMYVAAVRIAHAFSCDAIGIQYQLGLMDMVPASDLAEGLLNNAERPPIFDTRTGQELYAGRPVPHFNEVDECAGVDAVITNWVWTALELDPATTLHDVRWGEHYHDSNLDAFVWVFQISGAAPASHFKGGYAGATSQRQPPMYFRMGGGTLKGICKPGEIVWSRVFVEGGELHIDLGRATVAELPEAETNRRWKETTFQWPIMHAMLHGVTRDQFMARHCSNHLNVAYAPSPELAQKAMFSKAAMFAELGLRVHLCGI